MIKRNRKWRKKTYLQNLNLRLHQTQWLAEVTNSQEASSQSETPPNRAAHFPAVSPSFLQEFFICLFLNKQDNENNPKNRNIFARKDKNLI